MIYAKYLRAEGGLQIRVSACLYKNDLQKYLCTNNLSPHRFAFHHIVPEHDDESSTDLRQHVVQAEFFHKQPHADLVDPQAHNAGADEQRRLPAGLSAGAGKYKPHAEPVVDNDRNRKGDGRGVQVVDAKPFSTYVKKSVIHQKGCAPDNGEAKYFIELVFFHIHCTPSFTASIPKYSFMAMAEVRTASADGVKENASIAKSLFVL